MRALFVAPNLEGGGAERQWSLLLPRLAERGVDVAVLTLNGEGVFAEELRDAGVPVEHVRLRAGDPRAYRRVLAAVPSGVDIVVSRATSPHAVGRLLARHAAVPHVAVEHRFIGALPLSPRRRALTTALAPGFDAIVALSPEHAADLAGHGFPGTRIRVIPNGVDETRLVPSVGRTRTRAGLGLATDDVVALLAATLRPEKRVADFVAAVRAARERDPRIRGVVAGGGPLAARVQALAAEGDGAVLALGHRTDVAELLAAADVACLTSVSEALPMALLEAMAVGLPVLATAVGGVPDVVEDGHTGLLTPAGDPAALAEKLLALASDPARARRLGAAGRERQRREFGVERMVDRYELLLGELARRRADKRPAVALVGPGPGHRGGVASVIGAIASSRLDKRYRFSVVDTYSSGSVAAKTWRAGRAMSSLAVLLASGRVDVVHLHTVSRGSFVRKSAMLALARALGRPVVLHVHGGGFEGQLERPGTAGRLLASATRWMLEHADVVVALSSGSAARLGHTARRLHVVPNAPGAGAKPGLGDSDAPPSVLFLGRLDARKGVHLLVDAFAALHAERPDVRLVLAGDGPEGPRLARGIHSLGLAQAVELPGWLDDAEKAAALQRATCFVLPSVVEGMPLALLEAMAGGVAIVATAVGSVPETVGGGGIVVPPGDATALAEAVRRVVDDPALARTLGETGRRRVDERYSAQHFEQGLAAVYDGVLGER